MALQEVPRVFVVADESVIAHTLATILRQKGLEATAFSNPVDALVKAEAESPDLLISDVLISAMTGIDLAIKFKAICPDCMVLLFSGQAATANLLAVARGKGYDFTLLSKPVHPTDLLHAVRSPSMS